MVIGTWTPLLPQNESLQKKNSMIRLLGAFFRLVRWPNLVFIALTQFLFYYFILLPIYRAGGGLGVGSAGVYEPNLRPLPFYLLSLSSVLIAAAGYVINDYFDLDIGRVNRPHNLVMD